MYHTVCRYEYLTFQTEIYLHNLYNFDTNNNQSEYAIIFPFSIYCQNSISKTLYSIDKLQNSNSLKRKLQYTEKMLMQNIDKSSTDWSSFEISKTLKQIF